MTKLRLAAIATLGLISTSLYAKSVRSEMDHRGFGFVSLPFQLLDQPIGKSRPPKSSARPGWLSGNAIAAIDDGALVIDEDSGQLIRTGDWGKPSDTLTIGVGASQLVVDDKADLAYVVDRHGDRVVVVGLGKSLTKKTAIKTRAEPFGIAMTPNRKLLLVTTVADHQLTAYEPTTGKEKWSVDIGSEPRSVAISPSGSSAMIGSLTTGTAVRVDLGSREVEHIPLHPGPGSNAIFGFGVTALGGASSDASQPGRSFARSAFAATYVGHGLAIVPHQISTPHQSEGSENAGSYGGGFSPPVAHRFAVIGPRGAADLAAVQISVHQPRAVAYDRKRDRLYITGYGSDDMAVIGDVSQASIHLAMQTALTKDGTACGPTGIAIDDDGRAMVFCSLSRTISFVVERSAGQADLTASVELAPSSLSSQAVAGRALFRQGGNAMLSAGGALACESCHPEGRMDGLSWRIEGRVLQTPLLAGRVAGTHPFKWDGGDQDLPTSLRNTVIRLGGGSLTAEQTDSLAAYVESLAPPRTPTPKSDRAVARGKKLFSSRRLGCATCHSGEKLTDGSQYGLSHELPQTDTPSLVGVAASAPYYHDGSASSLRAVLMENGSIHGMGKVSDLKPSEVDDVIAYLKTL